jgi:hypothetical protein
VPAHDWRAIRRELVQIKRASSSGTRLCSLRICVQSRGFGTDSYCASYARTDDVNARVPYRAPTPGGFSIIEAFKIPLNSLRAVRLFAALSSSNCQARVLVRTRWPPGRVSIVGRTSHRHIGRRQLEGWNYVSAYGFALAFFFVVLWAEEVATVTLRLAAFAIIAGGSLWTYYNPNAARS